MNNKNADIWCSLEQCGASEVALVYALAKYDGPSGAERFIEPESAAPIVRLAEKIGAADHSIKGQILERWLPKDSAQDKRRSVLMRLGKCNVLVPDRVPVFEYFVGKEPGVFIRFGLFQCCKFLRQSSRREVAQFCRLLDKSYRALCIEYLRLTPEKCDEGWRPIRGIFFGFCSSNKNHMRCIEYLGLFCVAWASGYRFESALKQLAQALTPGSQQLLRHFYSQCLLTRELYAVTGDIYCQLREFVSYERARCDELLER